MFRSMKKILFPAGQVFAALWLAVSSPCQAADASRKTDGNRLTHLDEFNPFHPGLHSPKLTTPQWIGEPGVEAVLILSIDDMFASQKYETYLRPVIDRLKQIDGHAPLSIFCNGPTPDDPQLQTWRKEGLSFEIHTLHHPCPLLEKGNFPAATNTYHGCVELVNTVPHNKPVAYRMPCCDSLNSPSPRFYSEIFNRVNSRGQFLTIDTSVMNITTTNDSALPRELTMDPDGREKFRKYVPFPAFSTTIDNYPYPYQIGKTIWEFPCAVPSDWEAQHLHGTNNPTTVADWKSALDVTVLKQGVFTLVFHPHGWIRNDQLVELIDYAVTKYGKKVKFLNFREAQDRLNKNLLADQPLRGVDGQKNGVRLLDLDDDGYMDVVIGNDEMRRTRLWKPKASAWADTDFPIKLVTRQAGGCKDADARFGVMQANGFASFIVRHDAASAAQFQLPALEQAWDFNGEKWIENKALLRGLEDNGAPILTRRALTGAGTRLRDIDNDGRCELIIGNDKQNVILNWVPEDKTWKKLPFGLPDDARITDGSGADLGLRFVDVNDDGFADVLFSNGKQYSLHLFLNQPYVGMPRGWSHRIRSGKRGDKGEIPMIVRDGEFPNNGAWFRHRTLWVQNEDTASKSNLVDRLSFDQMLELEAPPAKSPKESLACIKAPEGFTVELVAVEPLIESPIGFEWGADGKLWVVEMGDYPLGQDGKGKAGGRVRFLEDANADGIYDKSTVFMDDVTMPTGIFPWRKGVLVAAAPDIFYAEDSDGDGRADVKNILYTGFHPGNPQHRVNGFDYGLDNWVYGANGDSGGEITSVKTGKKVNINGRDFRFRPDTGEFESESGQTQYGRHRDDWGNWFGNNNPNWLWHYLYPERYLLRNPHLPVRDNKKMLANYPEGTRAFSISPAIERFNDPNGNNHVTAGNSPTPYRDDLFGKEFASTVFSSDPVHNCVHREVLEQDGITFNSHRAPGEEQREFVASTDNWFRPTMLKTGPDGALYICDMYRLVIEHPEWIPADRQKRIDLRAGADKGRIYRVYPTASKPRSIPHLARLSIKELVAALDSPSGWQRDAVQRLIIEKSLTSTAAPLSRLLTVSTRAATRLHALCTLEGLDQLSTDSLIQVLQDKDPLVRAAAVRVSEGFLKRGQAVSRHSDLVSTLLRLTDDTDIRVRFQLAFSLGEWPDSRAAKALSRVALKDWNNPHLRTAVMSSATPHVGEMLAAILAEKTPPASMVEQLLGLATALNDEAVFVKVLDQVTQMRGSKYEAWQLNALAGFLDALDRKGVTLAQLQKKAGADLRSALGRTERLFEAARYMAERTEGVTLEQVKPAFRLLGRSLHPVDKDIDRLGKHLQPQASVEIQKSALTAIKRLSAGRIADLLLSQWQILGPDLKMEALDVLFSRAEWLEALMQAIEKGAIPPGQLGTTHQQKLLTHPDQSLKARASKLFHANSDRQKIVKDYSIVETLQGDLANGKRVFEESCAPCHRLGTEGNAIGPDLGMMADKPISVFLIAILDPNQAVEARYLNYNALTKNDREVAGIISTETPASITIKNVGGIEETVLRNDLKELKSSGLSLMPEGFENAISAQAMADLVSYLKKSQAVASPKP